MTKDQSATITSILRRNNLFGNYPNISMKEFKRTLPNLNPKLLSFVSISTSIYRNNILRKRKENGLPSLIPNNDLQENKYKHLWLIITHINKAIRNTTFGIPSIFAPKTKNKNKPL